MSIENISQSSAIDPFDLVTLQSSRTNISNSSTCTMLFLQAKPASGRRPCFTCGEVTTSLFAPVAEKIESLEIPVNFVLFRCLQVVQSVCDVLSPPLCQAQFLLEFVHFLLEFVHFLDSPFQFPFQTCFCVERFRQSVNGPGTISSLLPPLVLSLSPLGTFSAVEP